MKFDIKKEISKCNHKDLMISAVNIQNFPYLELGSLSLRTPTKGAEYKMVEEYVYSALFAPEVGKEKIFFLEPQVDSTFPDIVVVYFESEIAKEWSQKRAKLNKLDVRVLHYVFLEKAVEQAKLKLVFPGGFSKSLRRLLDADLVDYEEETWRVRPLQEIFAVQRLIAIEAKIKNWQGGLQQAFNNTWFASESYLLLPSIPKASNLVQDAKHLGVGLLTSQCSFLCSKLPSKINQLPTSYASWLFNEWAWQAWLNAKDLK